jgi:hypothetical protein
MPDAHLRQLFQAHLQPLGFHIQSIESWSTGQGTPDFNYCANGAEGWVECKATKHWRADMRPHQVAWVMRRTRAGGRVWVACRRQSNVRLQWQDELWLVPGRCVQKLTSDRLDEVAGAKVWHGGPARWDWAAIAALLTE